MKLTDDRLAAFRERGVEILAPNATLIGEEVRPEQFEDGVTIYPSVTIRGEGSCFGRDTSIGKAGGGYFENVACGRDVELFGGYFKDCVLLDGVKIRGHAEVRGGTLLEEECEGAHHVGYKMTVMLPWVVAGSLVNFCDALVSGGRSRKEHSEIGSTMALYNYSPWGDKSASLFGGVPRGVFLREDPIFIGGQTQIVSPVKVGFGTVIPAGSGVRRDVPDGQLYGEGARDFDEPFDRTMYGSLRPKFRLAFEYIAHLRALRTWYHHVRFEVAQGDRFLHELYSRADDQLTDGIAERAKRVRRIVDKMPASLEAHRAALKEGADDMSYERRHRRVDEHEDLLGNIDDIEEILTGAGELPELSSEATQAFASIVEEFKQSGESSLIHFIRDDLSSELVHQGRDALQSIVDRFLEPTEFVR
jgi:UDP-N-acetylglucosamine/UDP-N-acetylgalactosamine diphosphorylase